MSLPALCDLGAFLVLSHFSLLINPSLSPCSFDAGDGVAALILSSKKLYRWGSVIVIWTTRALESPSGEMKGCKTAKSPHTQFSEQHETSEGIPAKKDEVH